MVLESLRNLDILNIPVLVYERFQSFEWPIQVCLVLNVVVFLAWQIIPERFMIENFTESKQNLAAKRYWTLFTYAFSHISITHLLMNMACLTSIGPSLLQKMRPKVLFGVVASTSILAGVFAAILRPFHLLFWPQRRRQHRGDHQIALGFSGVNSALLYLFAVTNPLSQLSFMNFPPMPAQRAVKNLIYFDMIGMLMDMTVFPSPIGHTNHLGGYFSAMLIRYVLCSTPIGRQWITRGERFALRGTLF